jgi:hypothetical protein
MSHTPPIPQGNQSPYPLQEPPNSAPTATLPEVVAEEGAAVTGRLRDLPLAAIGVAVGLGAVLVGGLLVGLRGDGPKRGRRKRKA